MQVKFKNSRELLKVFGTIENILKKNKEDNKLKYVKLETLNNQLCIVARNPYTKLKYIVKDTLEIKGEPVLYDSKILFSLLNVLEGEIEIKEQIISNNRCKYEIPNIDVSNYPDDIIPNIINKKELNFEEFKNAITQVLPATSKVDGILSGIYININKIVSCDQNRIFIKKINTQDSLDNIVISKDLINEILKLPFEDKIYMSIFGNNIIFEDNNLSIASNMLVGKYPKYEMMLPKNQKNEILLKNKDLEEAINLILPIINIETMSCNLIFENNNLIVSVKNGNKKAETSINIKSNIKDKIQIKFNAQYLIDMLKANLEDITIKTYEDNIGFSFESKNSKQFIMPQIE